MSVQDGTSVSRLQAGGLARLDELIAIVCLVVIVVAVSWGVVTRYILPQPAAWTYEVATIVFSWLVFFGAAAGIRRRMHSDIDILVATFPPYWQRIVAIFNWWLLTAFFALLIVLFIWQSVVGHSVYTIALSLPRSVVYAPLALASLMMLLQHLALPRPWHATARGANGTGAAS